MTIAQDYLESIRKQFLYYKTLADKAMAQLEHLILTYPESALVPQARRTLDLARGAVPET